MNRAAWIALLTLVVTPPLAAAQSFIDLAGLSPYTQYKQFETEHFRLTYQEGYFEFAKRAATHLEHAHQVLSPLLKWQPRTKTHVLIADNEDSANGFAAPALRVGMVLIATPPDAWDALSYSDDWIKLLVFHEYTHILNIDPTTEWMEALRIFFGDVIRPNGLLPSWMLEGLAVYYETRTTQRGRGRSPYYEALMRAFLMDHRLDEPGDKIQNFGLTLDRINGPFPGFPGGEIPYVFGYELWQQMAKMYGDRSKAENDMGELSLRSSHRVPFFIEGNLENVTGKTWEDFWKQFVADTRVRLLPQIEKIRASGVTEFEPVTQTDYSALGGTISPDGKWLAYTKSSTYRRTGLYLMNLQTHEETRLDDKMEGVGLAFTPDSKILVYSSQIRTDTYHLFSDLLAYQMDSGHITRLTHGLRVRDPAISPDGKTFAFIKTQQGTHTLWTGQLEQTEDGLKIGNLKVVYRPKDFSILGTPKWLTLNRIVFSEQQTTQAQSDLRWVDVQANQSQAFLNDGFMNRALTVYNGEVYFVSNHSGVDNVFKFSEIAPTKPVRVSNVITGTNLPFFSPNGDLWASVLTSSGYQIGRIQKLPATSSQVESPANAPDSLAQAITEPTDLNLNESQAWNYTPWSSLAPRQWAPVAYIFYNSNSGFETAASVLGFDSTGKHEYFGLFGYQFKTQTFEPFVAYTYYGFRPSVTLSASSDTFDVFEDASGLEYKQSREVTLEFAYPIRWTFSSLLPTLYFSEEWNAVYNGIGQRVATDDPDYNRNQIPVIGANIRFRSVDQPRYAFMPERGDEFSLAGEGRQYDPNYAIWKYLITYQHYFPVGDHSVLLPKARWLGSSRTIANIGRSFAELEGKQTDDITDRATSSSLSKLGIRGYFVDLTAAPRAAGIGTLEYHFPIARIFRGSGTLPFFLEQAHGFVFADATYAFFTRAGEQLLPAYGGGVTLDTTLLLHAPIRFNLEYHNGTRKDFFGEQSVFLSISSDTIF